MFRPLGEIFDFTYLSFSNAMVVELGCVRFIEQGKISATIPQAMVTLFSLFYKLLISIEIICQLKKKSTKHAGEVFHFSCCMELLYLSLFP